MAKYSRYEVFINYIPNRSIRNGIFSK